MSFFFQETSGATDFMRLFDMSVESLRTKETFYGTHSKDRAPYVKMTPEIKARVLDMAREGKMTCVQIARVVGKSHSCVYKVIQRAGLTVPGMGSQIAMREAKT